MADQPKGRDIGYIRTSKVALTPCPQLRDIPLIKVFEDKTLFPERERPELNACLAFLDKGDRLHVQSMDRLARNNEDLDQIVDELVKRGISIVFHSEKLTIDIKPEQDKNLSPKIVKAYAKFEKALHKERQAEGIAKAKKAGKQFGRRKALTPEQIQEIQKRIKQEKAVDLADEFGVSKKTIYRALQE